MQSVWHNLVSCQRICSFWWKMHEMWENDEAYVNIEWRRFTLSTQVKKSSFYNWKIFSCVEKI